MDIFGFLKPARYQDATLGTLIRRGGHWHGTIALDAGGATPLLLAGRGAAPGEARVVLAREVGSRYAALRPVIERALWEHYEPYGQPTDRADEPDEIPRLSRPDEVWRHIAPTRVLIAPLGGIDTVEIAYRAEWDVEHTLGARFQNWALVELNGSVI